MRLLILVALLSLSGQSVAEDWTSNLLKTSSGDGASTTSQIVDYAKGLIPALKQSAGVNGKQARGGAGALFDSVKENLSKDDFSSLIGMVPGLDMDKLLKAAPEVDDGSSSLTAMLGNSDDALASVKKLYDQFNSLGLSTDQVGTYIETIQGYLQSEGGQQAVELFKQGLGALSGS